MKYRYYQGAMRTGKTYVTSTPTGSGDMFEKIYTKAVKHTAKCMANTIDREMVKDWGSNPCSEIKLEGGGICTLGENEMIELGTLVMYLKGRDTSKLGQNKKDIWKVVKLRKDYYANGEHLVTLESISKDRTFDTDSSNIISLDTLKNRGMFNQEYFIERAYNLVEGKTFTESKAMNYNTGNKNMVSRTVDANVEAAKVAATITAGNTLNKVVARQLIDRKVLPLMVRGYADTAFGAVVIANIADFAVKQFNVKNPKARMATEAMMQAAMVDLLAEVDFEGIINDVLANVDLGEADAS